MRASCGPAKSPRETLGGKNAGLSFHWITLTLTNCMNLEKLSKFQYSLLGNENISLLLHRATVESKDKLYWNSFGKKNVRKSQKKIICITQLTISWLRKQRIIRIDDFIRQNIKPLTHNTLTLSSGEQNYASSEIYWAISLNHKNQITFLAL